MELGAEEGIDLVYRGATLAKRAFVLTYCLFTWNRCVVPSGERVRASMSKMDD